MPKAIFPHPLNLMTDRHQTPHTAAIYLVPRRYADESLNIGREAGHSKTAVGYRAIYGFI